MCCIIPERRDRAKRLNTETSVQHATPGTSTFTLTVVGFVLLMIFVKLMSAMRDEQKDGTRYRNRFIKPNPPRAPAEDEKKAPPEDGA